MRERTELILPTKMKHGNQQEIILSESKAEKIHKTGIKPKEQLGKTKNKVKTECHDRQRKTLTNTRIISKKQEK